MSKPNPFRYFKTSPEIIRLGVMPHVRFPLSLRNVEDLLHERGVDVSHETVRFWWHRVGSMLAAAMHFNGGYAAGRRTPDEAIRRARRFRYRFKSIA